MFSNINRWMLVTCKQILILNIDQNSLTNGLKTVRTLWRVPENQDRDCKPRRLIMPAPLSACCAMSLHVRVAVAVCTPRPHLDFSPSLCFLNASVLPAPIFSPPRSMCRLSCCASTTIGSRSCLPAYLPFVPHRVRVFGGSWSYVVNVKGMFGKSVGLLCKAKKVLKGLELRLLYYAYIYPYLMYAIIIWRGSNSTTTAPLFKF